MKISDVLKFFMDKLNFVDKFKKLKRPDLLKHFVAGFLIAAATDIPLDISYSLLAVGIVGLGKEVNDKYIEKRIWGWDDLICTVSGGILYVFLRSLI